MPEFSVAFANLKSVNLYKDREGYGQVVDPCSIFFSSLYEVFDIFPISEKESDSIFPRGNLRDKKTSALNCDNTLFRNLTFEMFLNLSFLWKEKMCTEWWCEIHLMW